MTSPLTTVYLGLGANLGNAHATVRRVIQELAQLPAIYHLEQSSLYRSAPVDADGDDYINAVVKIDTTLSPTALLTTLQTIEHAHGRLRPYHHAPRTLDIDILLYGDQIITSDNLTIPHPHITQRAFVLHPLLQIAPTIVIPGIGLAHDFLDGVSMQKITIL